jgi:mRNA-degrading endonuclease toxin of MazEF toxin-antitoxin module
VKQRGRHLEWKCRAISSDERRKAVISADAFPGALSMETAVPICVGICPPYAARSTRHTLLPPKPNELEAVTRTR